MEKSQQQLNDIQRARLKRCEEAIQRYSDCWVEAGEALAVVKEERLYLPDHHTFSDYCWNRWEFSRSQAYRLIEESRSVRNIKSSLPPMSDKEDERFQKRLSRRAVRELAGEDPKLQPKIYQTAKKKAGMGRITNQHVRQARYEVTGKHDPGDQAFWPTPAYVVQALLDIHPPPKQHMIIEPSAGEGSIVRVLADAGYDVTAIEIRKECRSQLRKLTRRVTVGDWLMYRARGKFSVIGNPPYEPASTMLAHVEKAVNLSVYTAMLLPVTFLCSQDRAEFNRAHPLAGYYPFAKRPSTSGDGKVGQRDLAWYVHDKRISVKRRTLVQVL